MDASPAGIPLLLCSADLETMLYFSVAPFFRLFEAAHLNVSRLLRHYLRLIDFDIPQDVLQQHFSGLGPILGAGSGAM